MSTTEVTSVLHLSSAHPWTDNRIHMREAASLSQAGYDVGLYAVDNELHVGGTGVTVTRVPAAPRWRRVTLESIRAVRFAVSSKASIVHIHDPELVWAIPLLQIRGKRVIYDAHEDLPSQVMHKPYIPETWRAPVAFVADRLLRIANLSDHVIAATEVVAKRFDANKTTVVRNYPLIDTSEQWSDPQQRGLSVVYVGGLSEARGTRVLIEALDSAQMPTGWSLKLAGWGASGFVQSLSTLPGWDRVEFYGTVAPPAARELVGSSRVGLVVLGDTPNHRDALPTKMFEYMASGVPVIASDFPLWRQILEEHDCGLVVDPDSPEDIAAAIALYAGDPGLLMRHSVNGFNAVRNSLNWTSEAEGLVRAYRAVSR
ncbi:glycosyltransferase family 4 protein [Citricoccus alkalitolerans]|uniref:Glycosyltransferase family 4 protein n=1 Tax=Citricoccus alkalitolerans TaxID=246603 RepID=A0ABV8XV20_9MICC